jgi:hypothetical protein
MSEQLGLHAVPIMRAVSYSRCCPPISIYSRAGLLFVVDHQGHRVKVSHFIFPFISVTVVC